MCQLGGKKGRNLSDFAGGHRFGEVDWKDFREDIWDNLALSENESNAYGVKCVFVFFFLISWFN